MLTDEPAGADRNHSGASGWPSAGGWLRREAALTARMMADNLFLCVFPTSIFAVAAGSYLHLPAVELLVGVGKATILGLLFVYLNESSGQARSAAEDAHNKPYRPVPAGLITGGGLALRFWLAMPVYTLLGWAFGAWPWVLLWQATLVAHPRWASSRHYLWWKPLFNISGAIASFATGWQVTAPLDTTAWIWIATTSLYFSFPMIYEDVRDMDGDRAIGRRTPALVWGEAFVRRWFATFMLSLPCVVYFALAFPSGAGDWRGVVSATVLGILSWICAARALLRHGRSADRFTYQLFCLTWGMTVATAPLMLA